MIPTHVIIERLQAVPVAIDNLPPTVAGVSTDTRTVRPGELFVPLRGERFDGHDYLEAALARGAGLVLADCTVCVPHLRVANTLDAYQTMARWWRDQFTLPVVAVTGSAGKTTTRELIRAVLATDGGPVLTSEANENNDIGVAKLLLRLDEDHRAAVVEMGMRGPGEIARLTRTARPTVGVITNVGSAHIGRLGSHRAIAQAKCELLAELDPSATAVLNADDACLLAAARAVWSGPTITFGLEAGDIRGRFDGELLWVGDVAFKPPLAGAHNRLNFVSALAVASSLGLDLEKVRTRMGNVVLPGGRSGILTLADGITLLDETYNSAPESMRAALALLAELPCERRIAVLGQMRELGDFSVPLHRDVGEWCRTLGIDQLFVLAAGADTAALISGAVPMPVESFNTCEALAEGLAEFVRPGDGLLFKASRSIGLEHAIESFCHRRQRPHPQERAE